MSHNLTKAIGTAIITNGIVTILKLFTALAGGSASMMNSAIHSLINTLSQRNIILGFNATADPADQACTFTHMQKKHLQSTINLFLIGAGLGIAYSLYIWSNLNNGQEPVLVNIFGIFFDSRGLGLMVLGIAFITESYSFFITIKAFLASMRQNNCTNPFRYLLKSNNLSLMLVVLVNTMAILGLAFAALGISLTAATGNRIWDLGFSTLIAIMLGGIAFYLSRVSAQFSAPMRD